MVILIARRTTLARSVRSQSLATSPLAVRREISPREFGENASEKNINFLLTFFRCDRLARDKLAQLFVDKCEVFSGEIPVRRKFFALRLTACGGLYYKQFSMRRERLVKTLQVRLTAKQLRHLEAQACERGVSIGVIVREILRENQARAAAASSQSVAA